MCPVKVPGDFDSIQAAISAIEWAGIINVSAGTYYKSLFIEDQDVTITNGDSVGTVTIQSASGPVITTHWFCFHGSGVTLDRGSGQLGGGLSGLGASISLTDVTIQNCASEQDGGAVYLVYSDLEMSDSIITANFASELGGGVYASQSRVTIQDFRFSDNGASRGGGIYSIESDILVDSTVFDNNSFVDQGGGIWLHASTANVIDSEITNHSPDLGTLGLGGGLYSSTSTLLVERCDINSNGFIQNDSSGGGIALENSNATIRGSSIRANDADANGGGLFALTSTLTLEFNDFSSNETDLHGGALYVEASDVTAVGNLYTLNAATSGNGGAILINQSDASFNQDRILENIARVGNGGGMQVEDSSNVMMENVEFSDNSSPLVGGGINVNGSSFTASNLRGTRNSGLLGGCLNMYQSDAYLEHATLVGNVSSSFGGGIRIYDSSTVLTLISSIVAYNSTYNIYQSTADADVSIEYCDVFASEGLLNTNVALSETNSTGEPQFLEYDALGVPSDFHLALDSHLVDFVVGAVGEDIDGSSTDTGCYGGPGGAGWDRDRDGLPDYFWPGSFSDVPSPIDPQLYDDDDLSSALRSIR